MLSVGLTGGIASGKTTISNLFEKRGITVIDTDVISRSLLEPGELAYRQVRDHFGDGIVRDDGGIDRAALREIVFTIADQKTWLETMLHPLIHQRCHEAIVASASADYALVVVPLLFETNFQALVDRILAVDCPAEQQIERLLKRDRIDEALALKMLAQQLDNSTRLAHAHDIIVNRGDGTDLEVQVEALHMQYLELSKN